MMAETAEEVSRRPDVRKELERATGEKRGEKVKPAGRRKYSFVVHAIVLGLCAAVYFLLSAKIIPLPEGGLGIAQRILRGAVLITIVLAVARGIPPTDLLGLRMRPLALRSNASRAWLSR